MKPPRVKFLPASQAGKVSGRFPNFHRSGSVTGMRRMYYGTRALLVRCGQYIYNVTAEPDIYHRARSL